jgi:formylglycine-generating enzyme required for sulfatase activity
LSAAATLNGKKMAASAKVTVREGQVSPLRLDLKDATPAAPAQPAVPNGMVLVPGGTFTMGSPASVAGRSKDDVQHQVSLSGFSMGATDVTVGEFKAFVNATGYKTSGEADGTGGWVWTGSKWDQKADATWKNPYFSQGDANPVVLVSWYDAVAFCNWKSQGEGKSPPYPLQGRGRCKEMACWLEHKDAQ